MNSLKICMIVHKNYYQDPRVRRYVESLLAAGAQIDVICLSDHGLPAAGSQERLRVYAIPVHHADRSQSRYILEYIYAFFLFFFKLSILHIRNNYHLIHIHNMPDFLVFSALLPKMMGAKLILDIHDPMPEVFISKYGEHPEKLIFKLVSIQEKISCLFASAIITVNIKCKSNLVKRGIPADKITIIHNYPDPAIFNRSAYPDQPPHPRDVFTLIYPGTVAPRYGLDTVIRALPEIRSAIPGIRIQIIGMKDGYGSELQQLADNLGVASNIQFQPMVPPDQIPGLLLAADAGIYPALKDIHMNVATPTKVLEYAAMGIPIVSSRLSMVEEIFGETAVLFFEPGNEEQFARCIIRLYQDPEIGKELVRNMDQIFVKKHSWQNEFTSYFQLLCRLLPGLPKIEQSDLDKVHDKGI